MADTPNETATPEAGAAQEPKQAAKMQILTQFIKDMSFENIVAQKGVAGDAVPEVNVQVSLDAKKRAAENQYEVTSKYNISSTVKGGDATMFLLELEYTGIFNIENVPAKFDDPRIAIKAISDNAFAFQIANDAKDASGVALRHELWARIQKEALAGVKSKDKETKEFKLLMVELLERIGGAVAAV